MRAWADSVAVGDRRKEECQVHALLLLFESGHSQNGAAKALFQASVAMHRYCDDPTFAGLAVDVMTAVDPA
jgi:hypothetical protein